MANHYFYTVSSLPMLSYDADRFMTEEEFFDCCESTITEKDFQVLKSAGMVPYEKEGLSNPVLNKWNSWERSLRNELVKMRAGRKGLDGEKYIDAGDIETGVYEIARDAFSSSTPLEAEIILDRARWEYLENLEVGHHFDLGKLIVYYLQLQLLNRKAQMMKVKGESAFAEIYSTITEKAVSKEHGPF